MHALDRALLDDIRDASPWRSHDRPALFRALFHAQQQSDRSVRTDLPLTPSVLLSNSADAYRGRWVRLQGTIAKAPQQKYSTIPSWERSPTIPSGFILWILRLSPSASTFPIFLGNFGDCLCRRESANRNEPATVRPDTRFRRYLPEAARLSIEAGTRHCTRSRGRTNRPPRFLRHASHRLAQERNRRFSNSPILRFLLAATLPRSSECKRLDEILQPIAEPFKKNLDGLLSREIVGKEASLPNELLQTLYQLGRWNETVRWSESAGKSLGPWKATSFYGTARRVDRVALSAAAREWFGQSSVFRVEVESLALNDRKSTHRSFGHRRSQLNGSDQKSFHNLATYRDFNGHRRLLPPKLPPWSYATKWSGSGTMNMFPHPLLRIGSLVEEPRCIRR